MKLKKDIFMLLLITSLLAVIGFMVGNSSENRMTSLNKNVESIPVISSAKELKEVIESSVGNYDNIKVFIEGKISSKLSITDNVLDGEYIYIRKSFYDYKGKIMRENINQALCSTIRGQLFNTADITFSNPDVMSENNIGKVSAVKNKQYGTLEANISLGEIKSGQFHLNKSAKELKRELETDVSETMHWFYILWICCIILCDMTFIVKIYKKIRED